MSILFEKMAGELDTEMKSSEITVNIDNYRKLVKSYIDLHLYSAALFWADKVVALSNSDPRDIYWLAQCMFLLKQYHRAAHLIRNKGLDKTHVLCHYITVRSLLNAGEFTEALQVLESVDIESCYNNTLNTQEPSTIFEDTPKNKLQSSVMYLKGKVLEAMDNRGLAAECYAQALQYDVHCFEAFEALVQNQMLTAVEEQELIDSLPISQQCTESEAQILKLLYESKLKKYHTSCAVPDINLTQAVVSKPNFETKTASKIINIGHALESSTPVQGPTAVRTSECKTNLCGTVSRLKTSLDMKVSVAETFYYNCEYRKCIKLTEEILKCDPYHSSCLPVHIACLVELKESNELFYLAHRLVDLYPELAISWFAVGCYYYVIGKSDPARRFLSKATTLDKLFGPAWLAYGHSFAVENEHDQAMAAYFKACQLMKGCHLPLLYIGLECGLTNNEKLAEKFFQQAQCIAPEDPFVMHEMGVISFENRDYATAEKYFKDALARIQSVSKTILTEKWEPLLNNLGHTCRKRKKYQEALEYHQQALVLAPQNPSTYSAIGYVQALMGNAEDAANSFHKTLGLRKNDTFSLTMLKYVMEELLQNSMPYPDAPGDIPTYEYVPPKTKMITDPPGESGDGEAEPMKVGQPEPLQTNVTCLSDMSMSFE